MYLAYLSLLKKKIKAKYKDDQMETLVFFSEDSIYPSKWIHHNINWADTVLE